MSNPGSVTLLDCTLRDGGYYNDWIFERDLVQRYLDGVDKAGVDVVEVGFRTFGGDAFEGPFAHTTDDILATFDLPQHAQLAAMINVSDAVRDDMSAGDVFRALFGPSDASPVAVVRFAGHLRDVSTAKGLAQAARDLGYVPIVNLMQVSRQPWQVIQSAIDELADGDLVEVLYVADSLGDLRPDEVRSLVARVGEAWGGDIGFHAHDNRRLGVSNAVAAVEAGATWVDATIRGMGRGAGNAQTEFLAPELTRLTGKPYSVEALATTAMVDFAELQRRYGWGPDLLYLKAAERGVHPTYVQLLQGDDRYDLADMLGALDALGSGSGHSFSASQLDAAVGSGDDDESGEWDPAGLGSGEFLLLAPGPGAFAHADALDRYIRQHRPTVIGLNTTIAVDAALVSAFAACHPARLALEAGRLAKLDRPLVAPRGVIERIGADAGLGDVLDYGCVVRPGAFEVHERHCVVPSRLVFAYGLAIAARAGATRILIAGADGYGPGDARQEEMSALLDLFAQNVGIPIVSLTPTTYPVTRSSVYAPEP